MRSRRPSARSSKRSARARNPARYTSAALKVLALDYGSARTGVAVSDPTGTLARPVGVVERAATDAGVAEVVALAEREDVERIVVGLPVTLRGDRGEQAVETDAFVARLREATGVEIDTWDERFTTALAKKTGGRAPEDAAAAAHLLTTYLEWLSARNT